MASTKLSRTSGTPTSSKKFTISYWVKRSNLGSAGAGHIFDTYVDGSNRSQIGFDDDFIDFRLKVSGSNTGQLKTNRKFRDTSAWYHIVAAVDTTLSTADDRVKLYVNGVQETSFSNRINPSVNADFPMGGTHTIGAYGGGSNYFDGTLTHFHFTDGYTYTPTSFGEVDATSGIWKAKSSASVTYGTNGFFLKMENSGAMGTDSSGNSNNFTVSGTLTQNVDTPDNNFATMNPLDNYYSNMTFSQGNNTTVSDHPAPSLSTVALTSGKWYFEAKAVTSTSGNDWQIGIVGDQVVSTSDEIGNHAKSWGYYGADGNYINNNSGTSYGNTYTAGDIIGCAVDLTNNKLYFSKNGTWQNSGVPTSGGTGTGAISITAPTSTPLGAYFIGVGANASTNSYTWSMNFGNGYFGTTAVASANADGNGVGKMEYAVPTGYYTLNTKNLKEFG